jgi:WD40 repeat protein
MVHEATQSTAHVAFSPDGARLAGTIYRWGPVGAAKGFPAPSTIHIWDVGNGTSRAHTTTKLVVSQIEFTPDGARLVGAAADPPGAVNKSEAKEKAAKTGTSLPVPRGNHTCVWGGADGEELTLLRSTPLPAFDGRGMGLFSFHLSPDGRQLAAWGYSRRNNITLIDVDTGEERQVVKCIDMPHPVAFKADGSRLLAAVVDPRDAVPTRVTVNAWTVQQDKPAPPLPKGKLSGSREVAVWSTDRERQAVFEFGFGGTKITADISIRDKSGKVLHVFREHTGPLANAEFNANRSLVCSWTREGQVKVWETDTGKVRWSGARPPFKTNIDGSPVLGPASVVRNQRFLVLPEGKAVRIVAFDDLREILKIDNVTLGRLHFSPDSKRLVTAVGRVADGIAQMKLWDLETGREIQAVPAEFTHLQFSADSKWFALAMSTAPQRDGRIVVWNAVTGTKRAELTDHQSFRGQGMSRMMAFSPDGTRLAVASDSGPIGSSLPAVYDIPAEKIVFRLEALADPMSSLAFSPDGKRIVTGTGRFERREIRIWDASTGRELLSVEHDRPIPRVEFSPDGHRLIPRGVGPSAVILDGTPREALKKSH